MEVHDSHIPADTCANLIQQAWERGNDSILCCGHYELILPFLAASTDSLLVISDQPAIFMRISRMCHTCDPYLFYDNMSLSTYKDACSSLCPLKKTLIFATPAVLMTTPLVNILSQDTPSAIIVLDAHRLLWEDSHFSPTFFHLTAFLAHIAKLPHLAFFSEGFSDIESAISVFSTYFFMRSPYIIKIPPSYENCSFRIVPLKNEDTFEIVLTRFCRTIEGYLILAAADMEELRCAAKMLEKQQITFYTCFPQPKENVQLDVFSEYDSPDSLIILTTFACMRACINEHLHHILFLSLPKSPADLARAAMLFPVQSENVVCTILSEHNDMMKAALRKQMQLQESDYAIVDPTLQQFILKERIINIKNTAALCMGDRCIAKQLYTVFQNKLAPDHCCGHCSVCDPIGEQTEVTNDAKLVLTAVSKVGASLSLRGLLHFLRGSFQKERNLQQFASNPYYGCMKQHSSMHLNNLLHVLLQHHYLTTVSDAVRYGTRASLIVNSNVRLFMDQTEIGPLSINEQKLLSAPAAPSYYKALRHYRRTKAIAAGIPSQEIFGNLTLHALAAVRPQSTDDLLDIPRMSTQTIERYGVDILRILQKE